MIMVGLGPVLEWVLLGKRMRHLKMHRLLVGMGISCPNTDGSVKHGELFHRRDGFGGRLFGTAFPFVLRIAIFKLSPLFSV